MAQFDYALSRATAERLISRFGMAGTIRRSVSSGPSYDPVITDVDYACQLVVLEIDLSKIDGTLIQKGDRMVYVSTAGLSIQIAESDKVVIGGKEHAIRNVKPLSPAGLIVFYEVIVQS